MNTLTKELPIVVEINNVFDASLETVYSAFVEEEAFTRWGVGRTYENIALDIDLREGGVLHHRVRAKEDGSLWTFFGVYHEVQPMKKLAYTFDWKTDWREESRPSFVEITFAPNGDKTDVQLRHSMDDERGRESTRAHWSEFMGVLAEMLRSGKIS